MATVSLTFDNMTTSFKQESVDHDGSYSDFELMAGKRAPKAISRATSRQTSSIPPAVQHSTEEAVDNVTQKFRQFTPSVPDQDATQTTEQIDAMDTGEDQLPTPASEQPNVHEDELVNLGTRSKQLIKTIQKLELLQIQSTLPSLPKFVVVGDQSAGKSSIVEAVCDITLPRSQGTCTRCPFQITTTASRNGGNWTCRISLQKSFVFQQDEITPHSDGWTQQETENVDFATIHHKDQLQDMLIRAQLAILSPQKDPSTFVNSIITSTKTQIQFSRNLICLDIQGPNLPEVSFTDLPGSINVVEEEKDQHLVPFVENLVKSYLRDEKVLILLACASDADVETSTTFRFVRDCKAESRCLGVLTKPDLLPQAKLPQIARMLDCKTFRLGEGWYVSKQLSQAQLDQNLSHMQARELEREFFSNDSWAHDMAAFSGRLGISNLQDAISKKLTQHIINDLPEIINRVETRLKHVDNALSQFREKEEQPVLTVLGVISGIERLVQQHAEGSNVLVDFFPDIRKTCKSLRNMLKLVAPTFDPTTPGYKKPEMVLEISDDEEAAPTPTPHSNKRKATTQTPRSAKRAREDSARASPASQSTHQKARFSIHDVQDYYHRYASASLEGESSTVVSDILIREAMLGWRSILTSFMDKIENVVTTMLQRVAAEELRQFQQCPLKPAILVALADRHNTLIKQVRVDVEGLLDREIHKPLTFSDLSGWKHDVRKALLFERLDRRAKEFFEQQEARGGKHITDADRKKKLGDPKFIAELGLDPHNFQVEALVTPFGYYQMALSRFVDTVALHLNRELIHALSNNLARNLSMALNASDQKTAEDLLLEDAELERRRRELVAERERLVQARHELSELPNMSIV